MNETSIMLTLWTFLKLWVVDVGAAVTSLSVVGNEVAVGTVASDIYQIRLSFQPRDRNPSKPGRARVEFHGKNLNNRSKSLQDNSQTQGRRGPHQLNPTLKPQHGLKLDATTPKLELLATCHSEPIYDVTFPR